MKSQPPKKRTLMRTPLVPNVSLRFIAAKMASRVFSSAHTPPSPDVENLSDVMPECFSPLRRASGVASSMPCPPKKFDCVYEATVSCVSLAPTSPNLYGL